MNMRRGVLAGAFVLLGLAGRVGAEEKRVANPAEEAALQKNAEAFIEAFDKADAAALAAFWTADGDYTSQTGLYLKGRKVIEKAFTKLFDGRKGLKLRIDNDSLRFVTPDVAVEDGTTEVFSSDGTPPSKARYTIVHVKKDGQWRLSSVRDAPYVPPSNQDRLSGLEWVVGEWVDETDKGEVARASFEWGPGENFIVSSFTTTIKDVPVSGGTQWIGWDPIAKQVRSWTFDNGGGFGEGTWKRDGNRWLIKSSSVHPDGKRISATNIVTRLDADTISWESRQRSADGKALSDIEPVKMKRAKEGNGQK
jgi:uncharacterized protein (TIGR02246 family)